jgi:hypothetical protein
MFSRIQNLYLIIAALLAFVSMSMPSWSFNTEPMTFYGDFLDVEGAGAIVSFGSIAGGLLSPFVGAIGLFAVFMFENRMRQQKLIIIGILLCIADIASGLVGGHYLKQFLITKHQSVSFSPEGGFLLLLPETVLFILAFFGVRKDEKVANAYMRL